jgi:hypothetical protein
MIISGDNYLVYASNASTGKVRPFELRAAIVIPAAFRRMDTIHRIHIHTGGVFRPDTGFGDDVGHRSSPCVDRISPQKGIYVKLLASPFPSE